MKANIRDILASNLISVIVIFTLLIFFDKSGETLRNILLVWAGFLVLTAYDIIRLKLQKPSDD